eukprot:15445137-Alexandrium_andersonii.AAC.1
MDWKYWTWPRLTAPPIQGDLNSYHRFGWPLERVTRARAQVACIALDIHYKRSRVLANAPAAPQE